MQVVHLSLTDFRNYMAVSVAMVPGQNLFVGSNGQGKTNLIEALSYMSTLSSHRVSTDQALIRQGQEAAIIRARVSHPGREVLVEMQINRHAPNRAQINRGIVKPRDLQDYFSTILFAPEDLSLVRGEPSGRRRFLDQLLVFHSPRLSGVMADYDRVLRQRNSLLKSARSSGVKVHQLGTLEIWNEKLIQLGTEIIDARQCLVDDLREPVRHAYATLAGSDHHPMLTPMLSIEGSDIDLPPLEDSGDTNQRFRAAVDNLRDKELERGLTLVGPHRDDIVFELNGLPAKGYASHGESWSFSLALRLGSAELLRNNSISGDPIIILDDVFAELDHVRRYRLAEAVRTYEQVLITAAVLEDVPKELTTHTVHIRGGEIVSG